MNTTRLYVATAATLAFALASPVSAGVDPEAEGAPAPKEVTAPVSDPAAQAKTEEMLKEEAQEFSGQPPVPSEVKTPTSDPQAQEKTEAMIEQHEQIEESD